MRRLGAGVALCILGAMIFAAVPRWTYAVPYGVVTASGEKALRLPGSQPTQVVWYQIRTAI